GGWGLWDGGGGAGGGGRPRGAPPGYSARTARCKAVTSENPSAARRGLKAMVVGEIWRYPVKSMGGEQLDATVLTADGVPGDRVVHARDGRDVLTARSHPALLGFHATLGPDDEPLVDGRPWSSEAVAARVRRAVGGEGR